MHWPFLKNHLRQISKPGFFSSLQEYFLPPFFKIRLWAGSGAHHVLEFNMWYKYCFSQFSDLHSFSLTAAYWPLSPWGRQWGWVVPQVEQVSWWRTFWRGGKRVVEGSSGCLVLYVCPPVFSGSTWAWLLGNLRNRLLWPVTQSMEDKVLASRDRIHYCDCFII